MEAALRHLAERGAGRRRLAILGGMAELGDHAERHHREIAELAAELGIELLAVGDLARGYGAEAWEPDAAAALAAARERVQPGDAVLVKASRSVALEGIASTLANDTRNGPRLHRRADRDGRLRRDRAEVHRVPAPERARPADPRGGAGRARRQAGHAGDGRPPDHPLRDAAVPRALEVHAARADRALPRRLLRRDRVSRRLHQGPAPPLARAPGPVEARCCSPRSPSSSGSPSTSSRASTRRSTFRSRRSTFRSAGSTTPSSTS